MVDPGPPPWELPVPEAKAPRGRGPAKAKGPAAYRWKPEPRRIHWVGLEDCPGCGFLTVYAPKAGEFGDVRLDIWQVPYDEAKVLYRYNIDVLWRIYGTKAHQEIDSWSPVNISTPALLRHRCNNKWWLYGTYIGVVKEDS